MPLPEIADDITPAELADLLSAYWGADGDSDLARAVGVERGSIAQYRRRSTTDIQTKIIVALLRDIRYLESKLPS